MNVLLMLNERKKEVKKNEELMKRLKQVIDDACKVFINRTDLDTAVTDISNMFLNCSHLNELPDFYTID